VDYSTEQELKKIWRALRCKANCGSVGSVIEITKAAFLALVSADSLKYPVTYKITDVDNGLWVETLSNNTFSLDATISLFVPDYVASGTNLGQMDANTIPSVGVGEKVIWGDHYWSNTTGAPVTPVIVDEIELTGLVKEIKESGSSYALKTYRCGLSENLDILIITSDTGSVWAINSILVQAGLTGIYIYAPLSKTNLIANNILSVNNNNGEFTITCSDIGTLIVANNSGTMKNIIIDGFENEVANNISSGNGSYYYIKLSSGSRFKNNNISAASETGTVQLGFIELFDNCEVNDNVIVGNGVMWDIRTGENCKINSNEVNGGFVDFVYSGFSDIDQMQFDEVNGNILNGISVFIELINQLGYSKFNNNTFNGDMSGGRWSGFQMFRSEITDNIINADNIIWKDIWLTDAKLRNATDIQIQNCTFESIDLNLTGFTQDIIGETIQSGKGWFTITHDFATTPVNAGSSVLYNIIPNGARVTNIKTFGTATGGAGATLAFGIDTDAPSLLPAAVLATVNAGQTYNSVSTPATANRSLAITAAVGNVTGGEITVLVEFVL